LQVYFDDLATVEHLHF